MRSREVGGVGAPPSDISQPDHPTVSKPGTVVGRVVVGSREGCGQLCLVRWVTDFEQSRGRLKEREGEEEVRKKFSFPLLSGAERSNGCACTLLV